VITCLPSTRTSILLQTWRLVNVESYSMGGRSHGIASLADRRIPTTELIQHRMVNGRVARVPARTSRGNAACARITAPRYGQQAHKPSMTVRYIRKISGYCGPVEDIHYDRPMRP